MEKSQKIDDVSYTHRYCCCCADDDDDNYDYYNDDDDHNTSSDTGGFADMIECVTFMDDIMLRQLQVHDVSIARLTLETVADIVSPPTALWPSSLT